VKPDQIGFLFNSYLFLFIFLPVFLVLYLSCNSVVIRKYILLITSIIFYSFWDIRSLPILMTSMILNWLLGNLIFNKKSRILMKLGVIANLTFLASTKYFTLLFAPLITLITSNTIIPTNNSVWFPVGISFFTFTQIGFLIDIHRKKTAPTSIIDYMNFVTFFPHLIAGPILNFSNFVPQLQQLGKNVKKHPGIFLWPGFAIFTIGMAKKILIADRFAPFVNDYFEQSETYPGQILALAAILGFAFQLYFDFSGYSEMACGLAMMLGLQIPMNFATPYKSKSIIDFWRRWHISLSSFLRDYLYIPLGGGAKIEVLALPQSPYYNAPRRSVAWVKLDIRNLGTITWNVTYFESPI